MARRTEPMTRADIEKILRKRRLDGIDMGMLYVWNELNKIIHILKLSDDFFVIDDFKWMLTERKSVLYCTDDFENADNLQRYNTGRTFFNDYKFMFENFVRHRTQTAEVEFWHAQSQINYVLLMSVKLHNFINLKQEGREIKAENIPFDLLSQDDYEELTGALTPVDQRSIESSLYYISAYNYALDLLTKKYLIDLSIMKYPINELEKGLNNIKLNSHFLKKRIDLLNVSTNDPICKVIQKMQMLKFDQMTSIPSNRKENAQNFLSDITPFVNYGERLNELLCVFQPRQE